MLNLVALCGRTVRDVDLRYSQAGKPVARFTMAVDRPFKNAQGEKETDFLDCVAFSALAETLGKYLSKGRLIVVRGSIRVRSYEVADGQKRKATEVVADEVRFLDKPKEGAKPQGVEEMGEDVEEGDVPF